MRPPVSDRQRGQDPDRADRVLRGGQLTRRSCATGRRDADSAGAPPPARGLTRLLLATGPVAAACWAAALVSGRAWTWPIPAAAGLAFGAVLLLTVLALLAAATSLHSYRRTRLALVAGPAIIALDATAVAVAMTAAPALTPALASAVTVSLARIAVTARTLRRITAR